MVTLALFQRSDKGTIAERARYFKEDEKGVAAMCKMMEDMRKEAAEEAAKKAAEETATKLLRSEDMSYEKISEYSNLPLKEVEKLAKEMGL